MKQRPRQLRGEEKRERDKRIIAAYQEEGATLRSVGKRFGLSYQSILFTLEEYSIPRKPKKKPAKLHDVPRLCRSLSSFLRVFPRATVRECMEECGMSQEEVQIAARTLGHRFKKREKVPHERVVEVVKAIGRKQAAIALNLHPGTVDRHMQLERITPYVPRKSFIPHAETRRMVS